ncbi:MAG: thioredoxin domain-containing protein [Candidatus Acidiferrales bacterium]
MNSQNANRLQNSASPYLRSAAHQPVDWHEWGDEAFACARAEDKPILLDVGAVWCHWCHVIDRESYENSEIAALINQFFVPVKVDRDERPDVDARYQSAIGAISGQGGWPLTAFLTPDGKPFFGGTYFPPDDAMGRPGFRRILATIAESFRTRREEVNHAAESLAEAVAQAESFRGAAGKLDASVPSEMAEAMVRSFDSVNGGFGRAPKFPHPATLDLLLERYQATGEKQLLAVVEKTLSKMAAGGVYDQLAGGFHRYSVDERWHVPHFEKMSYDNSELLKNYLHAWQVTRDPFFREVAEGIIAWVFDTLSDSARGGFYSSQDADVSLDDDGDYFTWTLDELRAALSPEEARAAALLFGVVPHGEMHHNPAKNVLRLEHSPEEVAAQLGLAETDARLLLARARGKMLEARRRRTAPFVDATIYTAWNAMFVSAFLEAARILGRADCREFALRTLDRILSEAWDPARGFAHRVGLPRIEGMLDDQVFAAAALLDAYEATLDARYFRSAEQAIELALEKFCDVEQGGFFDRPADASPLGGLDVRRKPVQDSPTPGANSTAAIVLDRLFGLTGNAEYQKAAEKTLAAFAEFAPQHAQFTATYGLAALLHARHPLQVVVTGRKGDAAATALENAAVEIYRFGKAVLRVTPEALASGGLPRALAETIPHLDAASPRAVVCSGTSCLPPVADREGLVNLLASVRTATAH